MIRQPILSQDDKRVWRVLTVIGARPQFIKAMLLSELLRKQRDIEEVVVHTGQHYDTQMSEVFFRELEMRAPSYQLNIHGGAHGEMTGRMLQVLEPIAKQERPNAVLVYGDTNSTLAGALVAAKLCVPIIHVEAGLRSSNRCMPEEINRILADHVSDLLLCPTRSAVSNLKAEGIVRGVRHVGDIMYDVTVRMLPLARTRSQILQRLGLSPGSYDVATVHRAENTDSDDALGRVVTYLSARGGRRRLVVPLHPRTRQALNDRGLSLTAPGVTITEPLGYLDMCWLVHHARVVHTDSGGLQKEAYFHRVPCVTLRDETEWIETIEHGWNRLWSIPDYRNRSEISDYGTGTAANQMLEAINTARAMR